MRRVLPLLALLLGCILVLRAQADPVAAETVLALGPLPAPPAGELDARVRATASTVPEIDPRGWLPADGETHRLGGGERRRWQRFTASEGAVTLADAGVWWLAARLVSDRWSLATVTAAEEAEIWVDGELVAGEAPLPAGACFVMVRVAVSAGAPATVRLTVDGEAGYAWDLSPRLDFSRFDRARHLASLGSLAVAPRGRLVAYHVSRRDPAGEGRRGAVNVVDGRGELVAADLGGPAARPLAFAPDGETLLLRRRGDDGVDLLLWTAPRGPMRTLVTDEPDLGLVRWSPDGSRLLLASTRGLEADDPAADQRRWDVLRERVSDWDPRPHLHVVDRASGLRRVLTMPGDFTLDDAAWLPGGERVVYARTVPQVPRPWFRTELRVVDLASGEDRLAATFTAGWEVRPQALTPHPDGRRVLFVGPPDEIGGEREEHNVYNKQLWSLDLETGRVDRITRGLPHAFAGARGLPAWTDDDRLLASAMSGSGEVLVRLERDGDRWRATDLPHEGEAAGTWALAPDGEAVAYVASGPTSPRALWLQPIDGRARLLARPDRDLADRFALATAADASFTGPDGDAIEAWWYRPVGEGDGATPLIVYYYGGSMPTRRVFNTTHQFWAANGYAVLVINPRGAVGRGDDFADWHAGDWGPAAGSDILAGARALLARHPGLDRGAVGCYGGSYGGFMTMHLATHSDLFGAACAMYGIADLATYWGQGAWGWTYGDMAVGGRMPWNHPDYFTGRSPLFQAGAVQAPLLLLHGDDDRNVTPGQSVEMFTALQVQGKPVEMVTFAGEGHGIAGSWADYVAHRTMMLEWFDRWLKGRGQAWEHRWN
jgi:dipeptidyl aminopeptidase/acylaminoacyl peptidase